VLSPLVLDVLLDVVAIARNAGEHAIENDQVSGRRRNEHRFAKQNLEGAGFVAGGPSDDGRYGFSRLCFPKTHATECEMEFLERGSGFVWLYSRERRRLSALALGLRALFLEKVPAPFHPLAAEDLLGPELIVGSATHAEVMNVVSATEGFWLGVIELEKCASFATATIFGDIRTLDAVALEHRAARGAGDARHARL